MLWSDPGGVLASAGNTRLAGSTYSMENLEALCKKHFLDYVVRGHKVSYWLLIVLPVHKGVRLPSPAVAG